MSVNEGGRNPVVVRRAVAGDEMMVRDVRLQALADAPEAFGSTLERERDRTPSEWRSWLTTGATFVFEEAGVARAIAAGVPHLTERDAVFLMAVWVHPAVRRRGVGDALVAAVLAWAERQDAASVWLHVGSASAPARRLYERHGFRATGHEAVRERDGVVEIEMRRDLRPSERVRREPGREEERMRLISVNVGLPRELIWRSRSVRTSIWKRPVADRVRVHRLNLDGDQQSDLSVHGGPEKAVYAYPSEHYEYWRRELRDRALPWGAFGENLTTQGLLEDAVKPGDLLRVGSAELFVTQPRMPCYKLGVRFDREDMVKRFHDSGRSGFYLSVVREGELGAGDAIELVASRDHQVTIADLVALYDPGSQDATLLRRAIEVRALPEGWRERFRRRLLEHEARD